MRNKQMSNDEFLDDLMKQLYEKFGKPDPRKPGADENPPRNYYCGRCGKWITAQGRVQSHDDCE